MTWLGALCGFMAAVVLLSAYIFGRWVYLSGRPDIEPRPSDDTYVLADDISVPLIEVVLDAEKRAQFHPLAEALRCGPITTRAYLERAHELANRPIHLADDGVEITPMEPPADMTGCRMTEYRHGLLRTKTRTVYPWGPPRDPDLPWPMLPPEPR